MVCGPLWLAATQADVVSVLAGAMSVHVCNASLQVFLPPRGTPVTTDASLFFERRRDRRSKRKRNESLERRGGGGGGDGERRRRLRSRRRRGGAEGRRGGVLQRHQVGERRGVGCADAEKWERKRRVGGGDRETRSSA